MRVTKEEKDWLGQELKDQYSQLWTVARVEAGKLYITPKGRPYTLDDTKVITPKQIEQRPGYWFVRV